MYKVNNTRIGKKAVSAVQNYLDDCPKLNYDIHTNDTIPVFDGDILVYKEKNSNKIEDYVGPVRIQVKGSTDSEESYTIKREHVRVYENAGGCIFFKVLVIEGPSDNLTASKILYNILYLDDITQLLKKDTKTLQIQLKEMPTNDVFEKEVSIFAKSIGRQKVEQSSKKEIESLVNGFVELEKHYDEIHDQDARFELESQIRTIKSLKDDGSVLWRNKFYYHSRKAIDLAINNIKDFDFADLQFKLGKYLQVQKQYHLAEDYYLKVLKECRKRAEDNLYPWRKSDIATTLNNLAVLHMDLTRYDEAEKEYKEALEIRRELAKNNRDAYIGDVAMTLNNLGNLHRALTRYEEAEKEYKEALEIRRELAKTNRDAYIADVATTLNNLGNLHSVLTRYDEAETEYKEALEIRRELTKTNRDAYIEYVAMTLGNLGNLHYNLTRYDESEKEYKEVLNIFRELAETNHDAYIGYVAQTLNNLAILHWNIKRYAETEDEHNEALEIYRELARNNRDAFIAYVAWTLNGLGCLHKDLTRYAEAEKEYKEALEIRRELAETNRDAYIGYVSDTLNNLAILHRKLTRYDEAEKEYKEALEIYRELAMTNRDAYIGNVAMTLENIALLQAAADRKAEAKKTAEDALGIYKELARAYPQIWNRYIEKTERLLKRLNES